MLTRYENIIIINKTSQLMKNVIKMPNKQIYIFSNSFDKNNKKRFVCRVKKS
jgi:hypothetical protein